MSEKLMKAMEQYEQVFGDGFPTIPLMNNRSEEEVIEIIETCLASNKDAYDMGYLALEDVEY